MLQLTLKFSYIIFFYLLARDIYFSSLALNQVERHHAYFDNEILYNKVLKEAAEDALQKYQNFKNVFVLQQSMLKQATQPGKHDEILSNISRFIQLKSKGNVDSQQIHQTLYDSQPLRSPPPLILNIEETDSDLSDTETLRLMSAMVDEARKRTDTMIDLFEKGDLERDTDLQAMIRNVFGSPSLPRDANPALNPRVNQRHSISPSHASYETISINSLDSHLTSPKPLTGEEVWRKAHSKLGSLDNCLPSKINDSILSRQRPE